MDFEKICEIAISRDASDIHFSPNLPVFFRINGEMIVANERKMTSPEIENLLLKILKPNEKILIQKERQVDFLVQTKNGTRLRGNAFFQQGQPAIAFRIIPNEIREFFSLGFPAFVYEKIMALKIGFVLVVGATGQGKSTTLASIMKKRSEQITEHLITIEDPIEYIIPSSKAMVQQREVRHDVLNYKDGIKAALREDPDVILVGEMRDLETISAALTMAETGHLVFGTLHTNSGPETINRIIDVFPVGQQPQIRSQLATTLSMVIAQKLVPTADKKGRILAFEILTSNYAIKNYIRQNKIFQIPNAMQTDSSGEMILYEQSLAALFSAGKITKEAAFAFAHDPAHLESLLAS